MASVDEISVPHEVDVYLVYLLPNTNYSASVTGAETSGPILVGEDFTLPDPTIVVVDPSTQTVIATEDNDADGGLDPQVDFTVPVEGDYVFGVTDLTGATGTYKPLVMDPFFTYKPLALVGEFIYDPAAEQQVGLTGLPDSDFPLGTI
jgi:hypothetical protein